MKSLREEIVVNMWKVYCEFNDSRSSNLHPEIRNTVKKILGNKRICQLVLITIME